MNGSDLLMVALGAVAVGTWTYILGDCFLETRWGTRVLLWWSNRGVRGKR